jgi:hypothetical protein
MSKSLPPNPTLETVKKEAKALLKSHKNREKDACATLRLLPRFAGANDAEILAGKIGLQEVQHAVALSYGFKSWKAVRDHIDARGPREVRPEPLQRLSRTEFPDAPAYTPHMVRAYLEALHHAGTEVGVDEFAAASGWAFSFSYKYDDISPAFLALRGHPAADGPHEVFRFLPERLGYEYEAVRTADKDRLWDFIRKHIDAGTPVLSEQWDGGLVSGYRENGGARELWFVWAEERWLNIEELQPYEVCVLVKKHPEDPRDTIWQDALHRAVRFGTGREAPKRHDGILRGPAALQAFLADIQDPGKSFEQGPGASFPNEPGSWLCWAGLERLCARQCCGKWLKAVAGTFDKELRVLLSSAAEHYVHAGEYYDRFRREVEAEPGSPLSLRERARTPKRIAVIGPLLERGIAEESAGLDALQKAVAVLAQ